MDETVNEREQPEECDCCQHETAALTSYKPAVFAKNRETRWLCALCAGTMTSTFAEYPEQHDRDALQVMMTVCYVGNTILDALRRGDGHPKPSEAGQPGKP